MKTKKTYLGEISSSIVPKDLNKHARLAQVVDIDGEKGTCSIRFLDIPSDRTDVIILQSSQGVFNFPEIGSVTLVVFDVFSRPYIIGYINLGHKDRVRELKTLPKFKSGEKFFEAGGSYFYIRQNGNIIISTLSGNYLEIENTSGNIKFETVNWRLITEGGLLYFGLVKRLVSDGIKSTYKPITNIIGDSYTELNLKVMETADGTLGIDQNVEPLLELTLGTLIDKEGKKLNKNLEETPSPKKEVLLHLKLKNGIQIDIDKEGRVSLQNVKMNINNGSVDIEDPDIELGLESNKSEKGTRGQHVAREHDEVVIPVGSSEDTKHLGLDGKAIVNLEKLSTFITGYFTTPGGPITINPSSPLGIPFDLKGEITEGANNIIIGDD